MQAAYLAAIDWTAPWLAPYRELGQMLAASVNWRDELNRLARLADIRNFQGLPLQFIAQEGLPEGVPYEAHIGLTGEVPTRENLHDFFNGLVWLHFPRTKARLNQLQFEQLHHRATSAGSSQYRVGNARGKLRDAATIFDENAALLLTRKRSLTQLLRQHQWSEVFVDRREEFRSDCTVLLFGHALMEKLVAPYAAICAHCFALDLPAAGQAVEPTLSDADSLCASTLDDTLGTGDFFPVPVLGFPGWWSDQSAEFYSNAAVFRPKRTSAA